MQISIVKVIFLSLFASFCVTGCGGSEKQTSKEKIELVALEVCLDQGGEWDGSCSFGKRACAVRYWCKQESKHCGCAIEEWELESGNSWNWP